jgi:hypothetical protein
VAVSLTRGDPSAHHHWPRRHAFVDGSAMLESVLGTLVNYTVVVIDIKLYFMLLPNFNGTRIHAEANKIQGKQPVSEGLGRPSLGGNVSLSSVRSKPPKRAVYLEGCRDSS